jgi:hypothetical protein
LEGAGHKGGWTSLINNIVFDYHNHYQGGGLKVWIVHQIFGDYHLVIFITADSGNKIFALSTSKLLARRFIGRKFS